MEGSIMVVYDWIVKAQWAGWVESGALYNASHGKGEVQKSCARRN